jgi:hypothetical protein
MTKIYRVYCAGIEFGIDHATLAGARAAKAMYEQHFPQLNYYIREISDVVVVDDDADGIAKEQTPLNGPSKDEHK